MLARGEIGRLHAVQGTKPGALGMFRTFFVKARTKMKLKHTASVRYSAATINSGAPIIGAE